MLHYQTYTYIYNIICLWRDYGETQYTIPTIENKKLSPIQQTNHLERVYRSHETTVLIIFNLSYNLRRYDTFNDLDHKVYSTLIDITVNRGLQRSTSAWQCGAHYTRYGVNADQCFWLLSTIRTSFVLFNTNRRMK